MPGRRRVIQSVRNAAGAGARKWIAAAGQSEYTGGNGDSHRDAPAGRELIAFLAGLACGRMVGWGPDPGLEVCRMLFNQVDDFQAALHGVLQYDRRGVRKVLDEHALRERLIEPLIFNAVFHPDV